MELDYGRIKEAAEGYKKEMTAFLRAMISHPSESCERTAISEMTRRSSQSTAISILSVSETAKTGLQILMKDGKMMT